MSMHRALMMVVAGIMLLSMRAYAKDPVTGAYIGAGVGQAEYQDACDDVGTVAGGLGLPSSCEDKDTAFKIYGGYRFLPYLAAEIGYTNPGKVTATIGAASAELKSWEIPIYAVGILPLADDKLWLMAKVGGVYWDLKASASGPGGSASESATGFSLAYGAGVQYNFSPQFGVRAEYEVFQNVGDENTTGQGNIRMWSVGVVWRF
jgi:OOP family OmpA-OmpF porin